MSTENKDVGISNSCKLPKACQQLTDEQKRNSNRLMLLLKSEKAEPHLQPTPEVEKFISKFADPAWDEDLPVPVLEYLEAAEQLTAAKMAYFAVRELNYELLTRAVEKYGEKLISSIQLLRQANTYDDNTLVFMTSQVNLKTTPGLDDSEAFYDEHVLEAMAKLREEGKDKKVLDVMEANYRNSFKQT